jgi:hypothetical protein
MTLCMVSRNTGGPIRLSSWLVEGLVGLLDSLPGW